MSSKLVGGDREDPEVRSKVQSLEQFLHHLAAFLPLSSDTAECAHGSLQTRIHRFRGQKVSDPAAQEIGLWSIKGAYRTFWNLIWNKQGDCKARRRLKRFTKKGFNQHTNLEHRKNLGQRSPWSMDLMEELVNQPALMKTPKTLCGHLVNYVVNIKSSQSLYNVI